MISKPIAGAIADRFYCQKIIFLIAGLVVAGGFVSIYVTPGVPLDQQVHFSCDGLADFNTCVNNKSLEGVNLKLGIEKTTVCKVSICLCYNTISNNNTTYESAVKLESNVFESFLFSLTYNISSIRGTVLSDYLAFF